MATKFVRLRGIIRILDVFYGGTVALEKIRKSGLHEEECSRKKSLM